MNNPPHVIRGSQCRAKTLLSSTPGLPLLSRWAMYLMVHMVRILHKTSSFVWGQPIDLIDVMGVLLYVKRTV